MRPWTRAIPALLTVLLVALSTGCGPKSEPPNLVLITIDTVRADFLGAYGESADVSPNLDRLARNALVFEKAMATAPFTGPSHASILTSQHPSTHGVVLNGHRSTTSVLEEGTVTVAEHLADLGFSTAGVVSGGPLDERFGFGQGFDQYTLVSHAGHFDSGGPAAKVNDFGRDWLMTRAGKGETAPFFLWLHYFDPHLPYVSEPEFRRALGMEDDSPVTSKNVLELPAEFVRDAYRAEVREMDHHIGRFLDFIATQGWDENTIVAVVADHGEYLQEHGLYDHHGLRDEVLHVPMFIHWKGFENQDRRSGVVSTLDLIPTLMDIMGLDPLPGAQGRSLRKKEDGPTPPVFAEWRDFRLLLRRHETTDGDFQISVQSGNSKLIRDLLFPDSSLMFDHATDQAENTNLFSADPDLTAHLQGLLDRHLREDLPTGLAGVEDIIIDSESMEMLKSLGYVR